MVFNDPKPDKLDDANPRGRIANEPKKVKPIVKCDCVCICSRIRSDCSGICCFCK